MNYQKLEKTSMCYRCSNKEICKTVYQADDCGIQQANWNCPHFAEPKQQGEWMKCGWSIRCSICNYDMPYTVRNFCPSCGSDMRGEE